MFYRNIYDHWANMYISVQIYTYDLNKCCLGSDKKKKWNVLQENGSTYHKK